MMAQEQHKADLFFSWLGSVENYIGYGDKQFYMSLLWQHENAKAKELSPNQMFHLERLYNKYSMEQLQKQKDFEKNYSQAQRETAIKCAQYYDGQYPSYYDSIVKKVLNDPSEHRLTYTEYNKLCNNKYAKKVLLNYEADPKYQVGDFVQIRASNRLDIANTDFQSGHRPNRRVCSTMKNKFCMILEVNAKPITRAAKGARIYKVLIIDESMPIYAHESDLKKARRPKNA